MTLVYQTSSRDYYIPIDEREFDQLETTCPARWTYIYEDRPNYEFDNWKEELEDDERMNKEKTNKLHKMKNQLMISLNVYNNYSIFKPISRFLSM